MHLLDQVPTDLVRQHLQKTHTGVGLPDFAGEYCCYRGLLSDGDLPGLVMWFENEKHTAGGSCLLADLEESRRHAPRVASFIEGNPNKKFGPADLRSMADRELVLLSFDTNANFYYAIDGNNRLQAHYLSHRSIESVPAFLCVHPEVQNWAYIPRYHKPRLKAVAVS